MEDFSAEQVKRALRVNLEAPMLLAQALYPAMLERGAGHLVFVASLSGKAPSPALFDLQRDQVRPARLRPRPAHRPRPAGDRRLARLARASSATPGCSPSRGRRPRPGSGPRPRQAVAAGAVKAIEGDKVEIVVAPRAAAVPRPRRPGQPGRRRCASRAGRRAEGGGRGRRGALEGQEVDHDFGGAGTMRAAIPLAPVRPSR